MELAGFLTYTVASHQEAIKTPRLHFRRTVMWSILATCFLPEKVQYSLYFCFCHQQPLREISGGYI